MAYASWSVVFGEMPSAAKWNILGTNDASFNDGTGIGDGVITFAKTDGLLGWQQIGRTTLGAGADAVTVSSLPSRKYLKFVYLLPTNGSNTTALLRFNNDSGNNYAWALLSQGAAATSATSTSSINLYDVATPNLRFGEVNILNVSTREKIVAHLSTNTGTAGAGSAFGTRSGGGKWANTTDAINRIDIVNTDAGDFAAGAEIVVYGRD